MKRALHVTPTWVLLLSAFLLAGCSAGSEAARQDDDDRMTWFREARFGLFIHWGLYAIPAGRWEDETNHAEWIMNTAQIPVDQYEQYVEQFNPVKFDANEWVRIAKDAGMKYIVITSKHHDGFCLFDSEFTDYDIMSTPFQRDILKELSEAAHREGLEICWYHSIMDWHHPDYLPRRGWETRSAEGADLDRYVDHLRNQVTELLTGYGRIGIMWFDGEWEATWTHEYGQALYDLCRELQPDVIVNNRVDVGRGGMAGMTTGEGLAGDYGTPEQEIPDTGLPGVDWETCMTMNRHWGYNRYDLDYKSTRQLIRMLVDIASKGGNFLLNVGPTAEGEFPAQSVERLREMGAWMRVNGESIYGTTASPFAGLPWGRCTVKSNGDVTKLYLHVFDWPRNRLLGLNGVGNPALRAYLLSDPDRGLFIDQTDTDVLITLPPIAPDEDCSVVVLEIEGAPIVYDLPVIEASAPILVRELEVTLTTGSSELEVRYTLDGSDPGPGAPAYRRPIRLSETTVVKARSFHRGQPVSGVSEATFMKVVPEPALEGVDAAELVQGLNMETVRGDWDELPDFGSLTAVITTDRPSPVLASRQEYVALRFTGYIEIAEAEVYRFLLASDDGSRLLIGDRVVVDNDGLHGLEERDGVIALAGGLHPITVEWFNKTGGAELALRFGVIGVETQPIPDSAFWRPPLEPLAPGDRHSRKRQ
jgi:alpha-L-fucosidase